MRCKRCGNEDIQYFYKDGSLVYCRKCVVFGRLNVNETLADVILTKPKPQSKLKLTYTLTQEQVSIATQLIEDLEVNPCVLVYAACGAGKTEITMPCILSYLQAGKKVGYAISRRQVVLEIAERLQTVFDEVKVIAVCKDFTDELDADIIVCTMHQLYRYHQSFDLLILDEIDAFPYANNAVLEAVAKAACKGKMIMLTATPSAEIIAKVQSGDIKQYTLFKRPHGYPLVEPSIKIVPNRLQLFYLMYLLYYYHQLQWIVFLPTIQQVKHYYSKLKWFFSCASMTSKTEGKDQILSDFKDKHYQVLLATTILERGVTFEGVNVVIVNATHSVYNEASLIQMIGRVGRKASKPDGYAIVVANKKSKIIVQSKQAIERMNDAR